MKDGKGHDWVTQAVALGRQVAALRVPMYASHACYFIMLSAFPLLILLLSLLRYTGLQVKVLTDFLSGVIPAALRPAAEDLIVTTYYTTSGTVVSVSALTALWSAGRGVYGLMSGLNAAYGVGENRGYLYTRTVSVLYTFAFLVVLLLTLVLQVFGTTLLRLLSQTDGELFRFVTEVVDLRFVLLLALQTGLFTAMYTVLPNRKNRFFAGVPGALLASVGWLVFSNLYSVYVEKVSGYASLFGSVYGVVLSMLWLYFCICILFYGGALNHWLEKRR